MALLNEPYFADFNISDDNGFWTDYFTVMSRGDLPAGMGITSNAQLVGTPIELGRFDFFVAVYSYDSGSLFDDGSTSYDDGEWFSLFVTEASTNTDCPSPQNENLTEIYLCLGDISEDSLSVNEETTLDINYYANYVDSADLNVTFLDFTITYNPDLFRFDEDQLTSQILREAATTFAASVSYDHSIQGQLRIQLTANDEQFRIPGRLLDLPVIANQDVPAGLYDFTLTVNQITAANDNVLARFFSVDGSIEIEEGPEPAEPAEAEQIQELPEDL